MQRIFSRAVRKASEAASPKYPGTPLAKETHQLNFYSDQMTEPIPIYTTMDPAQKFVPRDDPKLSDELLLSWFRNMTMLRTMDRKLEATQRVGQNSFYMTARGEEGVTVVTASAFDAEDVIFTQYREQGVFLSRGVPITEMVDQVFANAGCHADGKQMPVHYGSKKCK